MEENNFYNSSSSQEEEFQEENIWKIVGILYAGAMILFAIGWIIYFKCYKKEDSKIQGIVWSSEPVLQEYFKIVPNSQKRKISFPDDTPSFPSRSELIPGLICHSVSEIEVAEKYLHKSPETLNTRPTSSESEYTKY